MFIISTRNKWDAVERVPTERWMVARGLGMVLLAAALGSAQAQIVLDGKFGASGSLTGPNYSITAGMGAIRGNNLFQSFSQFNLNAGETATFSGPANIQNILSRVTGGSPSSIDGTLRSSIAGANLFLINPSGVMFGPNAVVDVSGSFAVSTANYLKLASGARFVAALDADDSMLTTGPVVAFGFIDGVGGNIQVQGSIKAGSGQNLSLIGSTVSGSTISVTDGSHLDAPNGQIALKGVSAPGEVNYAAPAASSMASSPSGGASGSTSSGDIVIRGGRLVVDNATISASTSGGTVNLNLTEGLEVVNGAQITTTTAGSAKGGNIVINSPSVTLNGFDGATDTLIAAQTSSGDPQQIGGDITIHAGTIDVFRGSEISVSSFGAANAGRIDITTDVLRLWGSTFPQNPTQIAANAAPIVGAAAGAGGAIAIRAKTVEIQNGADISAATAGEGDAGSITITSSSLNIPFGGVTTTTAAHGAGGEIRIQTDNLTLEGPFSSITSGTTGLNGQDAAGAGGVIDIKTGSLRLVNNADISANTYGDAKGGDINIKADSVTLDNATFPPGSIPGISATSALLFGQGGVGKGGDITIDTGTLTLAHRMPISTTTSTPGDGGSIKIQAGTVSLDTGASIESASTGVGRAGTLSLEASQNILLKGASTVSTSAPQSSGGNLQVTAGGEIRLFNSSSITAEAGPGGGGNITLTAPSLTYLFNSSVSAQAVGDGGNLEVDPTFFIMNQGGLISKSSSKNGGNITLLSDFFFQSTSLIDASAPFGIPGTVSVSAPNVDLSGSLIGLPSNLLDVETQLRPDCGVRLNGNVSSFIVVGRGGLPIEPGGFVPSGSVLPPDEGK